MSKTAIVDVPVSAPADLEIRPLDDHAYWKVLSEGWPVTGERTDYVSADKRFYVGYSQYSKMTLELKDWPGDEFMVMIEGSVEVTAADGISKTYGPGDMFLIPKGFNGTWRQLGAIKKINIIYAWAE